MRRANQYQCLLGSGDPVAPGAAHRPRMSFFGALPGSGVRFAVSRHFFRSDVRLVRTFAGVKSAPYLRFLRAAAEGEADGAGAGVANSFGHPTHMNPPALHNAMSVAWIQCVCAGRQSRHCAP